MGIIGRFLLKVKDEPSVGASGALFGLVGVLFIFGIKFRHELPEGFKRAFGTGLLPMIFLNLFIGYMGRGIIDNAAHLGGFGAGAALALVVDYRRPGERSGVAIIWQVLRGGALLLVAISFVQVVRHFPEFGPSPPPAQNIQPVSVTSDFVVYARAMNKAQETLFAAIKEGDSGGVASAVQDLNSAPYLDAKANDLREGIRYLLLEAGKLNESPTNTSEDDKVLAEKKSKLTEGFVSWSKAYNEWLKTAVKTHGGLGEVTTPEPAAK